MDSKKDKKGATESVVRPKKRLGQNFLAETGIIDKLVAAANIKPGETVLEIGPGTGNLTEALAKTGNRLIAIEKDPDMLAILREKFAACPNVEMVKDDALVFDETRIAQPYRIAANLPFYIAAPLIRKFLESKNPPQSLTVIVQKEVAQRIVAKPPKMNLLAASVQFYAVPKIVSYISKGCFWPAPKVDCAILHLAPFPKEGERYTSRNINRFFRAMKAGFSQPRKQLAGNLASGLGIGKEAARALLEKNGIAPQRRAETLALEDWIALGDGI
ncbi:MAG: 16S rRNA (adenine(1518)-N(6)/adenine(1519)-N(6))-dimethyltransferase RsmA [Candidatus Pacebacteria bacterium]|jgi:16S rRNA (adenine1518-N6/adenine1519-N6)-dimethyltransferase|nr:16S rRNA (adenine(1518)-N(6)/adenine(1519)-N(6))-dimethyltransferase RsmA [Candidatus Paceibacterota bacterium]